MSTVYTRQDAGDVMTLVVTLPRLLSGEDVDPTGAVRELQIALGVEGLSIIKEAFIEKSRGGTDAAGIKWDDLKPATIAYGRRHPGLVRKKVGERPRGLLTPKQDERWRGIYASMYRYLRHTKGLTEKEAAGNAAAIAWRKIKQEGGKTILDVYGKTPVEIGRDTGRMFNSLSPGANGPSGDPDQVFIVRPGEVIVGTNVKYAGAFHAKRPLWPDGAWPDVWVERLSNIVADGIALILSKLLG